MKKKLPIVTTQKVSGSAKPVQGGSKPEFPTRRQAYAIGGALLIGGAAHADAPKPAPPAQVAEPSSDGSINGKPIAKVAPKVKVYREGGGIGPAEDMWNLEDVEAFVGWTMVKEGKLNLQTNYKLELDGLKLNLDGFDADKNIGFEYIDPHDPDQAAYTAAVRAKLDGWMTSKKVAILLIDVRKLPDTATLRGKVVKFLAQVKQNPPNPGKLK